jgi:hypothetical protein
MTLAQKISTVIATLLAAVSTAAAAAPWRFIVVGDSRGDDNGVNTAILSEIADRIVAEQPAFVLFPGDLVEGYTDTEGQISQLTTWRTTMQPVYEAGIRVLAVRGNHEATASADAWNAIFVGPYAMPANGPEGEANLTYSLAYRNAFVAGLDLYSSELHRLNQTWLDDQLRGNTRPHVFVFGHEPAFKAGHEDCLDADPAERDAFWAGIAGAGGRAYLCGHDHFYDHARIDNLDGNPDNDLHQLIVGTGGAPLVEFEGYEGNNSGMVPCQQHYASANGYVAVDIDGLQVTLTWIERIAAKDFAAMEIWSYTAAPKPGDLNCDGGLDISDAAAFVLALIDPVAYGAAHPGCNRLLADITRDGAVDGRDISPFVSLLIGR